MRLLLISTFLLGYLLLVFGVRTWLHWRSTGSTGFRGISGKPGSAEWWGGVLFVLALALCVAAPVLCYTALDPLLWRPTIATDAIGAIAALAGAAGTSWAQSAMGRSWRIGVRETDETELVLHGPFRLVRNPIFSFMMLAAGGLVLLFPARASLASFVCLVLAVELQVRRVEEPYLRRKHGEAFARYCRSVGRFVPGLGRDTGLRP